MFLNGKQEMD